MALALVDLSTAVTVLGSVYFVPVGRHSGATELSSDYNMDYNGASRSAISRGAPHLASSVEVMLEVGWTDDLSEFDFPPPAGLVANAKIGSALEAILAVGFTTELHTTAGVPAPRVSAAALGMAGVGFWG